MTLPPGDDGRDTPSRAIRAVPARPRSPQTVAQKIAANLTALGATRFDLKYGMGGLSHEALITNIELYGTHVIPRVRELLEQSTKRSR